MRYSTLCMVFVLAFAAVTSSSQTGRDTEPHCDEHSGTKVQINDSDATTLGFTIGRASLKDVQSALGTARTARVSSDEQSDIAICYVSPPGRHSSCFLLWSNGRVERCHTIRPVVTFRCIPTRIPLFAVAKGFAHSH